MAVKYFFANRRWMNPDSVDDVEKLRASWEMLSNQSIVFAGQCKWDKFVAVVRRYCLEWHNHAKMRRRPTRARVGATRRTSSGQCEYEPSAKRICGTQMSQEERAVTNILPVDSVDVETLAHSSHCDTRLALAMMGGQAYVDTFLTPDSFALVQPQHAAPGAACHTAEVATAMLEIAEAEAGADTGTTSPLPQWTQTQEPEDCGVEDLQS